jgi:hypothetical protein
VIAAVTALGLVAVVLVGVLVVILRMQAAERREWASERRALVDRSIARHTGEVIALDRQQSAPAREPRPDAERPVAVGI